MYGTSASRATRSADRGLPLPDWYLYSAAAVLGVAADTGDASDAADSAGLFGGYDFEQTWDEPGIWEWYDLQYTGD